MKTHTPPVVRAPVAAPSAQIGLPREIAGEQASTLRQALRPALGPDFASNAAASSRPVRAIGLRKKKRANQSASLINFTHQALFPAGEEQMDRKELEAILLRTQRLDSLGALAGGVMHDLNNCLAPILTSAELLKCTNDSAERNRCLDIITSNTRHATSMISQVLNFARGLAGRSEPVELQQLVHDTARSMRQTFPKTIAVNVNLPQTELWKVRGVPIELYQVLLNLCVNARDAMPGGGCLLLSAENVLLAASDAGPPRAGCERYVRLSATDTGGGIPDDVLPRIFDPFFTTKPAGQGTGLGLSTVAGIIRHHQGFIDVQTQPGQGTEFRIYLPAMEPAPNFAARGEKL